MRRLLAEWEPQEAVLLTWPHNRGIWGNQFDAVQQSFLKMAAILAQHQCLVLLYSTETDRKFIKNKLSEVGVTSSNITYINCESNDCWVRDYGPIAIEKEGAYALIDFQFNGWGGKFPSQQDNQINSMLYQKGLFWPLSLETVDFVLEAGSIDTDGQGTLLTTSQCLLSPHRNPAFTQEKITAQFAESLGVKKIHWLHHGQIIGDDTDGHIDTLARFCDPHTIAYSRCDDEHDAHHSSLLAMHKELAALRDHNNQPYALVPLPIPQAIYNQQGERLPATYVNFIVTNQQVLVPTYEDANDSIALDRLARCFKSRRIEPVNALPLIHQGGSLHCASMHLPSIYPVKSYHDQQ